MEDGKPVSLWQMTATEREPGVPFAPSGVVDLAVVGGGFTGLSTALHAAEKGLSVQVIEARHLGFGGSGRNVGYVNAGVWLRPDKVVKALGDEFGPRFIRQFGEAPERVFELIERHQIRCEATRNGNIHAAHAPSGMKDLEGRFQDWQRLGAPVELLSRGEMAEATGTRVFHGGLLDRRAGNINPMAYCRGLARAATAAGAAISTGVRVTALRPENGLWRVETDQGALTARNVVLGTNAYTDTLWPGLKDVFTTIDYLQVATAPLGPEAAHILPGRQGVWDTGQIMFNMRRDASDRLLIGTMGRVIGTAREGLTRRWAERQIARVFPDLGPVAIEEAWHGQIAMTPDHLPRIHRLAEGLWTPIGYNGRGITTGTVFGKAMADLLTGMDPAALPLPVTGRAPVAFGRWRSRFYDMAFTANQLWKGIA